MSINEILIILRWWGFLFTIGCIFFPLTKLLFKNSRDSFYIFSKVLGIGIISYTVFVLSTFHVLPFSFDTLLLIVTVFAILNFVLWKRQNMRFSFSKIIIFEEILFFLCVLGWSFVRGTEPSIHGLEKFMDFGFVNSILRTTYFPPYDVWFTPFSINYYFFGHLYSAVLTKLSMIPSNITYNLMIATLFAFSFTCGFSLVYNLLSHFSQKRAFLGGLLGGTLLSLAGNLQIIYAFFTPYQGDHPVPFWQLIFSPFTFPNNYWYPNATRFIPFTIHEFPVYSFVVSDLHGHVADIPFVLLMLGFLYTVLVAKKLTKIKAVFIALFLAIMYMTNVWDGAIYLLLLGFVLLVIHQDLLKIEYKKETFFLVIPRIKKIQGIKRFLEQVIFEGGLVMIFYALFTIPFSIHFKPFVSGIGILCAPQFLVNIGKLGPFIFEANHCQKSPAYQILVLYGFFFFFAVVFIGVLLNSFLKHKRKNLQVPSNIFILLLILLSLVLIAVPEFLYAKDIYPQHYRANTMFKLVYQAFILLSLSSAYSIVYLLTILKNTIWKKLFLVLTFILLVLVFTYPYFAIKSYYNNLQNYKGLNGTAYLQTLYPGDLETIKYLNTNVQRQPVILEAQGDSYTDYARISSNTGLPTVLGWTVHEWLWRGTYDIPAPRIPEVQTMYNGSLASALPLLKKYHVKYVVVGPLEHQKYPTLQEDKFNHIGKVIFKSPDGLTTLYKLNAQ